MDLQQHQRSNHRSLSWLALSVASVTVERFSAGLHSASVSRTEPRRVTAGGQVYRGAVRVVPRRVASANKHRFLLCKLEQLAGVRRSAVRPADDPLGPKVPRSQPWAAGCPRQSAQRCSPPRAHVPDRTPHTCCFRDFAAWASPHENEGSSSSRMNDCCRFLPVLSLFA